MDYDLDNVFNDESTKPQSNWFKFDKVGDKVVGVVTDIMTKAGDNGFKDQKVFTLRQKDNEEVLVGFSVDKEYIMQRTKNVRKGDILGLEFTKEIEPKTKGHHPAKSIEPRVKYTKEGDAERALDGIAPKFVA
jgi:tryptophan synthase alpha subunit